MARKGKLRKKLSKRLKRQVDLKVEERKIVLDQLALLDAEIDEIDEVIIKIDKKIFPIIDDLNTKIDAVKTAYDARIAAGCRSELAWETTTQPGNKATGGQETSTSVVVKNPEVARSINKYAAKYYKKQQNRDYGTNIIGGFIGIITAGHNILANVGGISSDGFNIGDTITDSISSPSVFTVGQLPEIIGFGTTESIDFTTRIQGSVSVGSTILVNTGIGTTSTSQIGFNVVNDLFLPEGTTITGFTEATVAVAVQNPGEADGFTGAGVTTTDIIYPAFTLSNAAVAATDFATYEVGITSTFPSYTISTTAQQDSSDTAGQIGVANTTGKQKFTVIRVSKHSDARQDEINALAGSNIYRDNTPDANFDFEKSPIDPIEVGTISNNKTVGFGHRIELVKNGDPPGNEEWESQKDTTGIKLDGKQVENDHPEPKIGGGKVGFSTGNLLWPVFVEFNSGNSRFQNTSYAPLGLVVRSGLGTSPSYTSVSPTGAVDGVNNGSASCADLDAGIQSAENDMRAFEDSKLGRLNRLIEKSRTLRKLRDRLELQAWGLLQGAAYNRDEIRDMLKDKDIIDDDDVFFDEFDPD